MVISIIALLVGILLPALGAARSSAKLTQCLSRQKQAAVGVYAYANDYNSSIPVSPDMPTYAGPIPVNPGLPTNQVFAAMPDPAESRFTGVGLLLDGYLSDNRSVICPDNSRDDLIGLALDTLQDLNADAYSPYIWRNRYAASGQFIDGLGCNPDRQAARVLLYDFNQTQRAVIGDAPDSVNHGGLRVNALYLDGHAETFDNGDGGFSLPATEPDPFGAIQRQLIVLDSGG